MGRVGSLADFGLGDGPLPENRLYTAFNGSASYLLDRATNIRGRFANLSTKILVCGCGTGAMVKHLTDLGYTDVWGSDVSAELITYGRAQYPALASRLLIADCLNNSGNALPSMTGVRRAAGLNGGNKFALLITDDLLTVLTDAEATIALTVLRATASTLIHVLWPKYTDGTVQDPTLNWRIVPSEWQAFIGGGEWVINAVTQRVYGANGVEL